MSSARLLVHFPPRDYRSLALLSRLVCLRQQSKPFQLWSLVWDAGIGVICSDAPTDVTGAPSPNLDEEHQLARQDRPLDLMR